MVIPRILQIVPSSDKHNIIGGVATQHNTQTWQYTSSIITHNNVACEPSSTISYKTRRKGRWRKPCNISELINYETKSIRNWHTTSYQNGHHEYEPTFLSDRSSSLYNMYPPMLCSDAPSPGWTAPSLPLGEPLATCLAFMTGLYIWRTLNPLKFPKQALVTFDKYRIRKRRQQRRGAKVLV